VLLGGDSIFDKPLRVTPAGGSGVGTQLFLILRTGERTNHLPNARGRQFPCLLDPIIDELSWPDRAFVPGGKFNIPRRILGTWRNSRLRLVISRRCFPKLGLAGLSGKIMPIASLEQVLSLELRRTLRFKKVAV
jgi:hypothetical protein